jgi:hypothetical protein
VNTHGAFGELRMDLNGDFEMEVEKEFRTEQKRR